MTTFRFQQFSVLQAKSAMKICTDATLFGAMAPLQGGERVLDIGSGNGLLSLMLAQLGAGLVHAVELTAEAHEEAAFNFRNSPWSERLHAIHSDIQAYACSTEQRYDFIISNPPFFENHTRSRESLLNQARHTDSLPYEALLQCVERLLDNDGRFYLLIPLHAVERMVELAAGFSLYPGKVVDFANRSGRAPKVSVLLFERRRAEYSRQRLDIYSAPDTYSEQSAYYLKPFLLRFSEPA